MEKISQILDVLNRIDRLDIPDKNETLESILKFASSTLEQLQEKQEKQEKQDKLISESNILPLLESDAPESSVSNKGRNFASSIPILKDKNGTLDYPLEILMEIFENSYWDLEGRKLNHSFYNFYDQYSEPDDIYGLDRDVLSRAQEISLPVEIHIDFIPDNYNLKRVVSLDVAYLTYGDTLRYLFLQNNSLRDLRLISVGLGDTTALALANFLRHNNTLISINLYNNMIGDTGIIALVEALEINKTLQSLDLSLNRFTSKSVVRLAEALQVNRTLSTLFLNQSSIEDEGAIALANVLRVNKKLLLVSLKYSNMGETGETALLPYENRIQY